jgi:L-gulonate 5-dehydrogenase
MELQQVQDLSPPGDSEVLVEVTAVGICGSDYSLLHGRHPLSQFPTVQGHELTGRILAYGPNTVQNLPTQAQVVIEPLLPCGSCYPCRVGRSNCCVNLEIIGVHQNGGLQGRLVVPERLLHDARGMAPEVAAFAEPMSIALQGLTRGRLQPDDTVLVYGVGPVGQAAIIAASAAGARVAAADVVPSRLERARANGAQVLLDTRSDIADAVSEWTAGEGVTLIIEASGAPAAIQSAVRVVAAAGRIVIIGISDKDVVLPVAAFTRKELTVLGSRNSVGIFGQAVDIVRANQEKVRDLVTHRIGLNEVEETIALALAHPEVVEKAVVMTDGS